MSDKPPTRTNAGAALFRALASIPLLERDRERLPIVAKIVGSGARLAQNVFAFRLELEGAIIRGATHEELEAMITARKDIAASELATLRQTIATWPAKPKPAPVVTVKALPRKAGR